MAVANTTKGKNLSSNDLIALWEDGHRRSPTQRALLLLARCFGSDQGEEIRQWPLGLRDQALLQLYALTFSPSEEALATCPRCRQQTALTIDFAAMAESPVTTTETARFRCGEERYSFRLPNSDDLLALSTVENTARARQELAARCIRTPRRQTEVPPAGERVWKEEILAAFGKAVLKRDPLAEVHLALDCPACGHRWRELFDIVDYFWRVLSREAQHLLRQVDLLARTYGWAEKAILDLSPARRALYMEMILS